jgi:glycosyltransferase involved in cell wall biosynthesis
MKILHLATSSNGGAGIAAIRLHNGLQNLGVDSAFISRENVEDYVHSRQLSRFVPTLLSKSLSFVQMPGRLSRGSLVTPFQIDFLKKYLQEIKIENFDVVHIHAPFNFIGEESIREIAYRSRGKIFITLHDQRFLTGGCHYTEECREFERQCQQCPQVRKVFQQSVAREHIKAKRLFTELILSKKIVLVAPSKWIAGEALRSTILENAEIEIIPNGIPNIFFDAALRRQPRKRKIVGFSSFNLHNPYKGLECLINAMRHINDATNQEQKIAKSDFEVIDFLHQIDILAVPSSQDNLPSVVLEALAAGVPVVGTSVGGIAEVLDLCQMPKVQSNDSFSLAKSLMEILECDRSFSPKQISILMKKKFSIEVVTKSLLDSYSKNK